MKKNLEDSLDYCITIIGGSVAALFLSGTVWLIARMMQDLAS